MWQFRTSCMMMEKEKLNIATDIPSTFFSHRKSYTFPSNMNSRTLQPIEHSKYDTRQLGCMNTGHYHQMIITSWEVKFLLISPSSKRENFSFLHHRQVNNKWTTSEQVNNKWITSEQQMNSKWTSEQQVNKWTASEQVNNKWTTSEQQVNTKWTTSEQQVNNKWTTSEQQVNTKWTTSEQQLNSKWAASEQKVDNKWTTRPIKFTF